jgi:hypothetical protein
MLIEHRAYNAASVTRPSVMSVEMTRDHAVSTPAMNNVASSRINAKVMPLRATAGRWSPAHPHPAGGAVD